MRKQYLGIQIDLNRDKNLSDQASKLLKDYYCTKDEPSPQYAFARAAQAYCYGDKKLAQRIYEYASKGWFMYSSPVLSNAPMPNKKPKALPISCFLTYVPDSLEGLIDHTSELRWLSVKGGGVGGHWSDVRSVSDIAPGPIPFLHTVDADMTAYRQGKTRKGSYAVYLDISHPDIVEFLSIRIPTGDIGRKCLNLHNAVNVTDDFMKAVRTDDLWELKDPNDGTVRSTLRARKLWEQLLETRFRTGEPYVNFLDTANRYLPKSLKDKGLKINGSNLCNEIHLPTNEDRTAVCCLSSLNLELYDDWKDTTIVRDLIRFLDNVLQFFVDHAPDHISRAKYSASQERSLGLGAMGYHSYLQKHMIPFEESGKINKEMFSFIRSEADKETILLGKEKGEAPDMKGTGKRNAHLLAIAPNANSSMIVSTSPSIEPHKANAYTHRTRAGSHLIKNKYLTELLEKYDMNKAEVWTGIVTNNGSIQHLQFLTDKEKEVFKTAVELDQIRLVELAGQRQKFLDQGQSLNLFFPAGASKRYVQQVHFRAWETECKGLYYLRTEVSNKAENISQKVELDKLRDYSDIKKDEEECVSCQG
jgi:ribonucleoside-diphosphate reductase alpha chain|tara:strand:- start:11149 stop:12912 length:1764 start_codon:yes stop_codon:yes gene_type:complete